MTVAGVAIAVGVVLVGGAVALLRHDHSTPAAFGPAALQHTSPGRTATTSAPASPTSAGSDHRPGQATSAGPALPDVGDLTRPTTLRVPALDVTAPVERVVTRGGVLGVPDDISHVGWWTGSALPGSPTGATVVDGHVDSALSGEGALFRLTELRADQHLTLRTESDREITYEVYARRVYSKSHALPTSLFDSGGAPRLVLITCGGPFDSAAHSYLDNIVVFARPVT